MPSRNQSAGTVSSDGLSNLIDVFHLILKKMQSRQKIHHDTYNFEGTVFRKKYATLGRKSLNLISSCILNHHFHDGAKLLWVMCQDRSSFDLFFYKAMMIVLEHIQTDDHETVLKLSSNIQHQKYINKLDVHLEFLMYGLKKQVPELDAAYKKLIARRNVKKIPQIESILSGYTALLDYILGHISCEGEVSVSQKKKAADKAIANLKSVLEKPGIWDVFVLKLIQLLQCYELDDEIEGLLKKYVECNPEHVNGYIYLSEILYKWNFEEKTFVCHLEELVKLCPSDERVLLLVQKWSELGKHLKKCLHILFMFLDYPVNGRNILGWKLLYSHLLEALSRKKPSSMNAVRSLWSMRSSSWKWMHFNSSNIHLQTDEEFQLLKQKIAVLCVIDSDHEYIKQTLQRYPSLHDSIMENEAATSLKKSILLHRSGPEMDV